MISRIKRMAVGQSMIYKNCPFCSSILRSAISATGKEYAIEWMEGMICGSYKVTRVA